MIELYAVNKLVTFKDSENVKSIQSASFHGCGYRDVATFRWTPAYIGLPTIAPLHLIRDGNRIPDVFEPNINLIVTSRVGDRLKSLPGVKMLPVVIDRFVDFYVAKGDFAMYEVRNDFDSIERMRNAPTMNESTAPHIDLYEVVVARRSDLTERFPSTHSGKILRPSVGIDELDYTASQKLLEEYPLHKHEGWLIMTPQVFESIESFFDWDFFRKQRLTLE